MLPPPLTRLIYTSHRIDGSEEAIDDILRSSLKNNAQDFVSGALVVGAAQFTQMLEGDRDKVGACLGRIQRDPRHDDIHVVCANEVQHRLFPDWTMRRFDEPDLVTLFADGRGGAVSFEPASLPQLLLEDIFRRLAVQIGRQTSAIFAAQRSSGSGLPKS